MARQMTAINSLERLAVLVVAVVGAVFMYGMLSMAWADEASPYWLLRCGYNSALEICGPYLYPSQEACLVIAERQRDKNAWKHVEYDCIPTINAPPPAAEQP